jgi:hypothetical protein
LPTRSSFNLLPGRKLSPDFGPGIVNATSVLYLTVAVHILGAIAILDAIAVAALTAIRPVEAVLIRCSGSAFLPCFFCSGSSRYKNGF